MLKRVDGQSGLPSYLRFNAGRGDGGKGGTNTVKQISINGNDNAQTKKQTILRDALEYEKELRQRRAEARSALEPNVEKEM